MEPREDTLCKRILQQFSYSFIIVIRLTFKLSFEIVFVTACEEQLFMLCFSTSVAEKSKGGLSVSFGNICRCTSGTFGKSNTCPQVKR
jgi:hypothetical protein